jgi:hypothetical protein
MRNLLPPRHISTLPIPEVADRPQPEVAKRTAKRPVNGAIDPLQPLRRTRTGHSTTTYSRLSVTESPRLRAVAAIAES